MKQFVLNTLVQSLCQSLKNSWFVGYTQQCGPSRYLLKFDYLLRLLCVITSSWSPPTSIGGRQMIKEQHQCLRGLQRFGSTPAFSTKGPYSLYLLGVGALQFGDAPPKHLLPLVPNERAALTFAKL